MADLKKEFRKIVNDYFLCNDKNLHANKIFDSFNKHIKRELNLAFYDEDNHKYLKNGCKTLVEFMYRYETDKGFDLDGITKVLFSIIDFSKKKSTNDSLYMIYKYLLLKVSFVVAVYKKKWNQNYKREPLILHDFEDLNCYKTRAYWFFRGQRNSKWKLKPTCLRNLHENTVFDHNYYISCLEKMGLHGKYREEIRLWPDESEYYEYAFMQHACSFSPLIDFSREEGIAGTFAFRKQVTDAKIYMLSFNKDDLVVCDEKEAGRILCQKTKIFFVDNETIRFGQTLSFKNNRTTIELRKIDSIIDILTPKPTVFSIPTNDRMKKQKGVFLLLSNCLALKGEFHLEFCKDLFINEFKISINQKKVMMEKIQKKYPQYSWRSLMDPYKGFEKNCDLH